VVTCVFARERSYFSFLSWAASAAFFFYQTFPKSHLHNRFRADVSTLSRKTFTRIRRVCTSRLGLAWEFVFPEQSVFWSHRDCGRAQRCLKCFAAFGWGMCCQSGCLCFFCVYLSLDLSPVSTAFWRSDLRIRGGGMGGFLHCSYFAMLSVQQDPRTKSIYLLSSSTIYVHRRPCKSTLSKTPSAPHDRHHVVLSISLVFLSLIKLSEDDDHHTHDY
jgi:hypothetical protein